jgi:sugar phosphate permease
VIVLVTFLVGVSVLLFTASGIGAWLTIYHHRYSGMSEGEAAGVTASILVLGGIAGTLWGGRMADRVFGRMRGGRIVVVVQAIIACMVLFIRQRLGVSPIELLVPTRSDVWWIAQLTRHAIGARLGRPGAAPR